MGHRISKATSSGSITNRTKISKNCSNISQQQHQQQILVLKSDETTKSETQEILSSIALHPIVVTSDLQQNKSDKTTKIIKEDSKIVATSLSPQQIIIKIQLAKMESEEVNETNSSHSKNNLNAECSTVLNLSYEQNIPCENNLSNNETINFSSLVESTANLDTEKKINNFIVTNNNNCTIDSIFMTPNSINIINPVPFIDDNRNDLNSCTKVSDKTKKQHSSNITEQSFLPEYKISNDLATLCRLSNTSTSSKDNKKLLKSNGNQNSTTDYSDLVDVSEKVMNEEESDVYINEESEDKIWCSRKTKSSSTYPCLSKCSDAIKQFLNSSKVASKRQEKEKKSSSIIPPLSIFNSDQCLNSATDKSEFSEKSSVVDSSDIDNNLPISSTYNYHSLWAPTDHLTLWAPPRVTEMMIPIATTQQIVVLQYPNTVLRFSPNTSSIHDNTVASTASVRMVATEFEIIGGHTNSISSSTTITKGSAQGQVINSSSIKREGNGTLSISPAFHSQVDYIHCLVPDLDKITKSTFYWGKIDRYEAERLLEGMPEGTFLLRDSAQEEYLFSVTFRKYGRSLHARIEQLNHKFSFDCHDPGVFTASTVTGLLEHYKDPSCVMFFEPMLTIPLHRKTAFSLQQLCRATIVSNTTYDGISELELPTRIKAYLKEYHYKQRVRVNPLDESFYTMRS